LAALNSEFLTGRERARLGLCTLAVLLTRLPWIKPGYGTDPDSYRVVAVARQIAQGGPYEASRLPGYPAFEYLTALTAWGPAWITNAVTALFSAAAYLMFTLILRYFAVPRPALVAAGFAMTPVIYINSSCTMDYVPALACMLAATYALLCERPGLAGLCLGMAVGFRITSGALALPCCLWLWWRAPARVAARQSLQLCGATLLVSAACFAPVWDRYGRGFFGFYDNPWYPPWDVVAIRALPLVWGSLGVLALAAAVMALPLVRLNVRTAHSGTRTRDGLLFAALTIGLYLVAFLRLPDEAGYLVPLVPFALLALSLLAPSWLMQGLAVALLCSPFVALDRHGLSLRGPMLEDHAVRASQQQATEAILAAADRLPGRAVIVAGWVLPRLQLALGGDQRGPHRFVYLVEGRGDFEHYVAEGYRVYFLPKVELYESQAHDLELSELGAKELPVPPELQRSASTGE
jgi:hypothetical protein